MKPKDQQKLFEKLSDVKKIRYSLGFIQYDLQNFKSFFTSTFALFLILILLGNPLIYVLLGLKKVAILTMFIFILTIVSFVISIKRHRESIKLLDEFLIKHGK